MAYTLKSAEGQVTASSAALYTCPLNKTAFVSVTLTNTSDSTLQVEASIQGRLITPNDLELEPGDSYTSHKHTLTSTDAISAVAQVAGYIDYKVDILERSTS